MTRHEQQGHEAKATSRASGGPIDNGRRPANTVRKWAVIFLVSAAVCPSLADAAQSDRGNALVVYPLSLALGKVSLTYQKGRAVVHAGCHTGVEFMDVGFRGCEGAFSYRFVLAGPKARRPLGGLFIAPLLSAGTAQRMVQGEASGTASSVGFGFDVGFQAVTKKGLTLNVSTGWRHRTVTWGTADVLDFPRLASPVGAAEWWPGVAVGIGFAF